MLELFVLAVGLSMDAFAVAICRGLRLQKLEFRSVIEVSLYFGLFQAIMPLCGYFFGMQVYSFIEQIDHWVAFALLSMIGVNMIKNSREEHANETEQPLFILAIATSLDSLAVGISLIVTNHNIFSTVLIIGLVTFSLSAFGVFLGFKFGDKHQSNAEMLGGFILIALGLKILIDNFIFQ